jgi:hypothetical protein
MPRLTAEFFTDDAVDTPYWWEAAKPSPVSADEIPDRAEVAIVGGGFTGLNAGLRRLIPERRIAGSGLGLF